MEVESNQSHRLITQEIDDNWLDKPTSNGSQSLFKRGGTINAQNRTGSEGSGWLLTSRGLKTYSLTRSKPHKPGTWEARAGWGPADKHHLDYMVSPTMIPLTIQ